MRFYIETLGCKVNQFESAAMARLLTERGHTETSRGGPCDVVVLNTCAVTGDAARQSRQAARRLLREHPGARLAICGCASQIGPEQMRELGAVLIGGSGNRAAFAERLESLAQGEAASFIIDDPGARREIEHLPSGAAEGRTRAMLKIQDGCNNFCSYCIIPYVRGYVRSLEPEVVAREARSLALQGFHEIVLTGIEISSYGKDLPDAPGLEDAVRTAARAAPGTRIRLGSLEPSAVDDVFVRALRDVPNLCGHFHLSLQSGSDAVLRRMRRKYDTGMFYGALSRLRAAFPNCGATADLIAGFPGETEAEFGETLNFLEKCAFSDLHVFPYSKRPGTPAASMPEQLQNAVKRERAARAREVGGRTRCAFIEKQLGKTLDVLLEREIKNVANARTAFVGHSGNYLEIMVEVDEPDEMPPRGSIVPVRMTHTENGALHGVIERGA